MLPLSAAYYTLLPREGAAAAQLDDPNKRSALVHELIGHDGPAISNLVTSWTRTDPGPDTDWIWALGAGVLMSSRFRDLIEGNLGPADEIEWLSARVRDVNGAVADYWIARFLTWRDLLDEKLTQRGPSGLPMVWYLSEAKMSGVRVAAIPRTTGKLIVDGEIMRAMRRQGMTGVSIMRSRVVN